MSFIVEDGSGVKDATSYGTVAGYKAYWKDRGVTVELSSADIQVALIKGTSYIEKVNGNSFGGRRQHETLFARSAITFSGQPAADETVVVGSQTYTFKVAAALDYEVEIGASARKTLDALLSALAQFENDDFVGSLKLTDTIAVVYTKDPGAATTTTASNLSWSAATSSGDSFLPQPLSFPRINLYTPDGFLVIGVPRQLEHATYEYANRAVSAALLPDPGDGGANSTVTGSVTQVGPIRLQTNFSEALHRAVIKSYPDADLLLAPFLVSRNQLVRS